MSPQIIKLGKENQGMHRNHSVFNSRLDQRYNSHNSYINSDMDKPKSILTNRKSDSSRDHLISDLRHGYSTTFLDGFSYKDEEEEIERVRLILKFFYAYTYSHTMNKEMDALHETFISDLEKSILNV